MLINWFTVFAQVLNFLVLIWLLKRFLYGPIIRAMNRREQSIAGRLLDAEKRHQTADQRVAELAEEKLIFERERESLRKETEKDLEQRRESALKKMGEEIADVRESWIGNLREEQQRFSRRLTTRIAEQVMHVSRKVLEDLGCMGMECQIVEAFIRKLAESRETIAGTGLKETSVFVVQSGFDMPTELRKKIGGVLREIFQGDQRILFETHPRLGPGIQLVSGDWKVEWNLDWYLKGIEKEVLQTIMPAPRRRI